MIIRLLATTLLLMSTACTSILVATTDENGIVEDPGVRTAGTIVEDESIETKVTVNMKSIEPAFRDAHFNVISHKHLVNVLAVVVRYFGGVKLGAGGLVRAYGGAISQALEQAEWVPVETLHPWVFGCPFALESELRRLLERYQLLPGGIEYTTGVTMEVTVPESQLEDLRRDFCALAPHRNDLIEHRLGASP